MSKISTTSTTRPKFNDLFAVDQPDALRILENIRKAKQCAMRNRARHGQIRIWEERPQIDEDFELPF